jgi:hypothetical protein
VIYRFFFLTDISMALYHRIEKVSVGDDGKSLLLHEATTGYGVDPEPPRADVIWLTALYRNQGTGETLLSGGLHYQAAAAQGGYEAATPQTATHLLVELDTDGFYRLESVLVPRQAALDPAAGLVLVNSLCGTDEGKLRRITGVTELLVGGEPTGTFVYQTTSVEALSPAINEGYPSVEYPILQLYNAQSTLDQLAVLYQTAPQQKSPCQGSSAHSTACTPADSLYSEGRALYFDMAFVIAGAEGNLASGLRDNVVTNLRSLTALAADAQALAQR